MSQPRSDRRTKAANVYGHPDVSYPYGKLLYPRIVEQRTERNAQNLPDGGTAHPDAVNFPNALLIELDSEPGDNTDTNWTLTYETLPGPALPDITADQDTGIPVLTSRQKVPSTTQFFEGEIDTRKVYDIATIATGSNGLVTLTEAHTFVAGDYLYFTGTTSTPSLNGYAAIVDVISPTSFTVPFNVTVGAAGGTCTAVNSIVSISTGQPTTVTFSNNHYLPPGAWVTFAGTDSTPSLNGTFRILDVPAQNQVTIDFNISSVGSMGRMQALNGLMRELKDTGNLNYLVKVDSMIAIPDVTVFNEDIAAWKEYSFPDFLLAINAYRDSSTSVTGGMTDYGFSETAGGSFGLAIRNGYRGPCEGRRLRLFSVGPISDATIAAYSPTLVIPVSGNVVIQSRSVSIQGNTGGSGSATSQTFKSGSIPPVLSKRKVVPDAYSGAGQATFSVALPESVPESFSVSDTITLLEQPQKLRVRLWQVFVWQFHPPYTMDNTGAPATLAYSSNPASYTVGTEITTNNPSYSGGNATSFSVNTPLPAGLKLNGVNGVISGNPTATHSASNFIITATNSIGSTTATVNITVT